MATIKITLNELRSLVKQIIKENTEDGSVLNKVKVEVDGKAVDVSTIELDGVYGWDRPDFVDAYASAAKFEDGEELNNDQLADLQDNYPDLINNIASGYK